MSLLGVIDDFATGTYTVTRPDAPETHVDGIKIPATTSTFQIVASIQPMSGRDLKIMAEFQHAEEMRVVFTATEIRTRGPWGAADALTIDDERWEVKRVEEWNAFGDTHYRAYVTRVEIP